MNERQARRRKITSFSRLPTGDLTGGIIGKTTIYYCENQCKPNVFFPSLLPDLCGMYLHQFVGMENSKRHRTTIYMAFKFFKVVNSLIWTTRRQCAN
jgi:hypothetical protein